MNNSTFKNGTGSVSRLPEENIFAQLSPKFYLTLIVVEALLASTVTLGNFLLLLVIYLDPFRCLRTPTAYLIANLGVADLLVGAFVGYCRTAENYFLYRGLQEPPPLNTAQYIIGGSAMFVVVCTIIAMSWERYIAVSDPYNYNTRITVKRVKLCILGIWINALFLTVLPAAGVRKLNFLFAYCYSHFLIPAVFLTVVYIMIFRKLSTNLRNLNQTVRSENSAQNKRRNLERERRLAVTILLVLIAFYTCFAPYFVKVHLWLLCGCEKSPSFLTYHLITNDILFLFSLLDPIIYAWRLECFRKSFRRVLGFERNAVTPELSAHTAS